MYAMPVKRMLDGPFGLKIKVFFLELILNKELIRQATIKDVDQLLELQKKWEMEDITYGFVSASRKQIEESIKEIVFIFLVNDVIVGFISGRIKTSTGISIFRDGEKYLDIEDLYIESASRNNGIGKILFKKIEENAKALGVEKILVYSSTKDIEKILHFYKTCGMQSWYIQMYK